MRVLAKALGDDAAVAKVAIYVASLPKSVSATPARGDLHNGNNLYQGKCGACHGGKAEGNPALKSPRLAGLDAAYLKRQFAHFRDGVRGTRSAGCPRPADGHDGQDPADRARPRRCHRVHSPAGSRQVIRALVLVVVLGGSGNCQVRPCGRPAEFTLTSSCPPGFEKTGAGVCELRTLYQFYAVKRGLGGTRTALPPHRDGFTPHQIDLGRYLFFDPVLSGDGTLSCASCHDPRAALSDGRPRSIGIHGADAGRAAPTLWNVAFLKRFFWDARADSLEAQAAGPLYSPREMGNTPAKLLASLNGNATYRRSVPRSLLERFRRDHRAASRHGARRFPDFAGLAQQPLRPLCPWIRRRALRA